MMFVVLFFLLCTIEPTDFALPTELTNIIAAHVSGVFRISFNLHVQKKWARGVPFNMNPVDGMLRKALDLVGW